MNPVNPAEQAPTPSVEERAGKAFSKFMGWPEKQAPAKAVPDAPKVEEPPPANELSEDPQAATTEAEAPTEAEETFEFEFDGDKYALPKKLERAVQNMKDYTQKTQGVSEQRKAAEHTMKRMQVDAMRSQFETQNAELLQKLSAYDALLNQRPNWEQMDQATMSQTRDQRHIWKEDRDALARELNGRFQQFQAGREKALNDLRNQAKDITTQKIPGWEAAQKAVREHALNEGYTEAELDMAQLDPRHNITLWKAQQYDLLKANATKSVSDVKSVKTKPATPMPQDVKDKLAFNKAIKSTAPGSPEQKRLVEQRVGSLFAKR